MIQVIGIPLEELNGVLLTRSDDHVSCCKYFGGNKRITKTSEMLRRSLGREHENILESLLALVS